MANLGYIQVTRRCNQCCRFCSNPPIEKDIGLAEGKALVDQLITGGYDGVIFTGGEPTLSKHLPAFIEYATASGLAPRIVTNGQRLGQEPALVDTLLDAGLQHVHVSLYSNRPDVVAALTGTQDSLENVHRTLTRIGELEGRLTVDVNTVINHFNADHLHEHVDELLTRFPFIHHMVFNNLDPFMNRVAENPDTIPALWEFELSLHRALRLLTSRDKTFRIERVPLCYMVEHAHCSTETRKIVKAEHRVTHFLDEKGQVTQTEFLHDKAECCEICHLSPVCAGLDGVGGGFHLDELYPVFISPIPVIARVLRKHPGEITAGMVEVIAARQRAAIPRSKLPK